MFGGVLCYDSSILFIHNAVLKMAYSLRINVSVIAVVKQLDGGT